MIYNVYFLSMIYYIYYFYNLLFRQLLNTSTELEATRVLLSERIDLSTALEHRLNNEQLQRSEYELQNQQTVNQMQQKIQHLLQEVQELEQCRQQQLR